MSEVKFIAILECGASTEEHCIECETFDAAIDACLKWLNGSAVRPYASICMEQVVGTKLHETLFTVKDAEVYMAIDKRATS